MGEFNPARVLHGSGGMVWVNKKKLATLQSVEIKVTGDFEDINVCGDPATYSIYNGFSVEGTLTYLKVDSDMLKVLSDAYHSGVMPEMEITTRLRQKGTNKSERAQITGVIVTEFMLAKFEKKAKVEEEVPFKAADFHVLETI